MDNISESTASTIVDNHHEMGIKPTLTFQIIAFTLFTTCSIVGIVGNSLVIFVVVRVKGMKTLTNMYLVSLACADLLVLMGATLPAISEVFLYRKQWVMGGFMCSLLVFLQYLGINTSALSITAFTIERYIGICHPFTAQVWSTRCRVKWIIAGLWGFSIAYNSCWLYLATTFPENITGTVDVGTVELKTVEIESCTFRVTREEYMAIYMPDLILFYILPLILIVVLYSLIGITLRESTLAMSKINGREDRLSTRSAVQRLVKDPAVSESGGGDNLIIKGDNQVIRKIGKARNQVSEMFPQNSTSKPHLYKFG